MTAVLHRCGVYEQILERLRPEDAPLFYSEIQNHLGIAYGALPLGNRATNLKQASACYQQALRFYTSETAPADYAMLQNNLGLALSPVTNWGPGKPSGEGHYIFPAGSAPFGPPIYDFFKQSYSKYKDQISELFQSRHTSLLVGDDPRRSKGLRQVYTEHVLGELGDTTHQTNPLFPTLRHFPE